MADPAINWTKVLTHPLGLGGYALFLLFGLLARIKRKEERRWILPSALAAAGVALLGGIGLAYHDINQQGRQTMAAPVPAPQPVLQQMNERDSQRSAGTKSPNVQGVQGDVTINYGTTSETQKHHRQHNAPEQKTTQRKEGQ